MTNYTILLIDYAPRSVAQLRAPLEAAGYTVEVAENGPAGLEAFRRIEPDLTMIEPMLPKKPGLEVCKELKDTDLGKGCPILILTSIYQGRRYRDQAQRQSRCDGFLDKPIREEALLDTVQRHLLGRDPRSRGGVEARAAVVGPSIAQSRPAVAAHEAPAVPPAPLMVEPSVHRDLPAVAVHDGNATAAGRAAQQAPPGFSDATEAEILDRLDAIMPD